MEARSKCSKPTVACPGGNVFDSRYTLPPMDRGGLRTEHSQLLYRACLEYWRRTHAELVLITGELRAADTSTALTTREAALGRALLWQRSAVLQRAIACWASAAMLLDARRADTRAINLLRHERATVKELETTLAAAQEAEVQCRQQWATERQEWKAERERWAAERREWERQQREQEQVAAAVLQSELSLLTDAPQQPQAVAPPAQTVAACVPQAAASVARGQRPLGACAQRLLAAWDSCENGDQ